MTCVIGDTVRFRIDPFHHIQTGRVVGVSTSRGVQTVDVEDGGERFNSVMVLERLNR